MAEEIASFACDPLGYAHFTFPWGERGTPLAALDGPRRWQVDILRDIGDHLSNPATRFTPLRLAVASGHGAGKSSLAAIVTNWALSTCVDTRVVVTANTENQLTTKTSPELQKWHRLSLTRDWFKPSVLSLASGQSGHGSSWRADLIPWSIHSPESFAGLHNQGRRIVLIFDESAAIADRIWEVAEGALTDQDTEIIWLALGNPTRNSGRFKDCFGKFRNMWRTRHVDSRDVEGVNRAELDEMIANYGADSDFVKVRIYGQFPSVSSMQFISTELVDAARSRTVGDGSMLPNNPIIFGLDHARFGDDASVLAIRQGRDARSRPWKHWVGANSMEIAGDLAAEAARWHPDAIMIDAGGPNAGGVIDRTRQLLGDDIPVFEVNFGGKGREASWNGEVRAQTANKRAEMYSNMRAWLDRGAIPEIQQLCDDLTSVEYGYDVQNRIQLEKKEHMKARGLPSPDWADALALTFAEHVEPRSLPAYLDPERYRTGPEFDRYADQDDYVRE